MWGLALVLLAAIAALPIVNAGWIWDDDSYVTRNRLLTDPDAFFKFWWPGNTPQYYPMVFTSFWIETLLYGDDFALKPLGFHLVNWALHCGSGLFLWRILERLGVRGAWLGAALFLVHPMQVESVAWVTERKNVLAVFFALASLRSWLAYGEAEKGERAGYYVASLVLFALAMLSKTMVASLAPSLIALHVWQRKPMTKAAVAAIVPFFLVGIPLGLLTVWVEATHVGASGEEFALSALDRVVLVARTSLWYVWTWCWPTNLAFIYERWTIDATRLLQWIPVVLVLILTTLLIMAWRRGYRGPAVIASIYFASVFPALGFFNVYPFLFSYVADHFAYVGTVALAAGSGWALVTLARRVPARAAALAAGVLLVAGAARSSVLTLQYENVETLWRSTLATNPNAWLPASNLASVLLGQSAAAGRAGDTERAMSIALEAETYARRAVELFPQEFTPWAKLSEALRLQGRYAEALEAAHASLEREPRIPETHWLIGRLHELLGDRERALAAYREGATLPEAMRFDVVDEKDTRTRREDFARMATLLGRDAEAASAWERAAVMAPNDPVLHGNVGLARERLGQFELARDAYKNALSLTSPQTRPADRAIVLGLLPRLVNVLLSGPPSKEAIDDALHGARWLVEQSGGNDPLALLFLARAERAAGLPTAATSFAEAKRRAEDPALPQALRDEIAKFEPLFASP